MRMTGGILITPARTSEILGCTTAESRRLLRDLGKEGHISPTGGECWEVTVKGKALASATAAKPLRRATVDRLVSELLGRVREVNRDGQWANKVEAVVVFGSGVTQKLRPSAVAAALSQLLGHDASEDHD